MHAGAYDDFFRALRADDAGTVRALLARGVDPNTVDDKGYPALSAALRDKAGAVVRVLLAHPAIDVERRNALDETPLMIAAYQGDLEAVRALLARGAQLNRPGWTPLHYAATGGHLEVAKLLIEASAYIDAESPNGTTPLMMAARQKQAAMLKLLVEEGADPTLRNQAGLSAVDYLERTGERETADWMRQRVTEFRRRNGADGGRRGAPAGGSALPGRLPGQRPTAE